MLASQMTPSERCEKLEGSLCRARGGGRGGHLAREISADCGLIRVREYVVYEAVDNRGLPRGGISYYHDLVDQLLLLPAPALPFCIQSTK